MRIGRLLRFGRRRNPEFWLGNQARDLRRWREAAGHYEKALALQPERAAIWVQYGHALKEAGDLAAGERAYRKAIALAPEVADTHLQLGHALKLQGRGDEAATAYLDALDRDPHLHAALFELSNLGWAAGEYGDAVSSRIAASVRVKYSSYCNRALSVSAARSVVIDVSDLVDYFQNNRIPTGIQRVQINVATSLLREVRSDPALAVASLRWNGEGWTILPEELFLRLADLALAGGEGDEPWRAALSELFLVLASGEPLAFPAGAVLVTMGGTPSSWLQNYFLILQSAKNQYGIRYVPFVHDCIPLLGAQHCSKELTGDFIGWLIGAFLHADGFLVNSRATAQDLASVARLLGRPEPRPAVVPLGACSSSLTRGDPSRRGGDRQILGRYGLKGRDFVLFVSTIESRKNHPHAFEAWLSLIKKRGARRTPMLVCVGKQGWRCEPAMARLAASPALRRKVLILSKVSDCDLAVLYRRCLFTLYPSSYEGWGLPVTESLYHGKVPLIARASSLPEAGGDLAEYFDLDRPGDLLARLERLIEDRTHRDAREARIRRDFTARTWRDIALEIVAGALAQAQASDRGKGASPLLAETGRYYALARNRETRVWPGMTCGEMYRVGYGWSPPDERGCRLRREEAEIAFSLAGPAEGVCVYLGVCAAPTAGADYRVWVAGGTTGEEGMLAAGEERWIVLTVAPDLLRAGAVHIKLATSGHFRPGGGPNGNRRRLALGVLGFYLCRQQDAPARQRFLDALQARHLDPLRGGPADMPAAACAPA
jgi:glycosyltransferase involved in cell wall biosynthesis